MMIFKNNIFLLGFLLVGISLELISSTIGLVFGTLHSWLFGVGAVIVLIANLGIGKLNDKLEYSLFFSLVVFEIFAVALYIVAIIVCRF